MYRVELSFSCFDTSCELRFQVPFVPVVSLYEFIGMSTMLSIRKQMQSTYKWQEMLLSCRNFNISFFFFNSAKILCL
jgi:hypothetical protein